MNKVSSFIKVSLNSHPKGSVFGNLISCDAPFRVGVAMAILFWFCLPDVFAGDHNAPAGARSSAMGNASATQQDVWASFHNQAGLAFLKETVIGVSHEQRFMLNELSLNGAAFALPTKKNGTFALSVSYFGYKLYNEQKAGLAYAKSFGDKFSAGVQIDYLGTSIAEGYGS